MLNGVPTITRPVNRNVLPGFGYAILLLPIRSFRRLPAGFAIWFLLIGQARCNGGGKKPLVPNRDKQTCVEACLIRQASWAVANQTLQQTGHAKFGILNFNALFRVSRLLSVALN